MNILYTAVATPVALGLLIAVHELGHFLAARGLGVSVLRFSIGLGPPLLRHKREPDGTEYVLALLPLGGYVKMLDHREGPVPATLGNRAFDSQALWKRSLIVAAGPFANFLFAILAYWAVMVAGETGLRPIVGAVEPGSLAAESGFRAGDEILRIDSRATPTWENVGSAFLMESLDGRDMRVRVRTADGEDAERTVSAAGLAELPSTPQVFDRLGLSVARPELPAVIGYLTPDEPAVQAGLAVGDRILSANGKPIANWRDWVDVIRKSPGKPVAVELERAGTRLALSVAPRSATVDGAEIGRIGAGVESRDDLLDRYRVEVQYGPVEALEVAVRTTVDMSVLMVRVMARLVVGQASVEHLSGPISIAETAGRTASFGLKYFVKFLAVVSVSLAVLNLLPIPVLDGGHLLYFFIEWVRGRPLSERAQSQGQMVGITLILALTTLAFYSDLTRIFG